MSCNSVKKTAIVQPSPIDALPQELIGAGVFAFIGLVDLISAEKVNKLFKAATTTALRLLTTLEIGDSFGMRTLAQLFSGRRAVPALQRVTTLKIHLNFTAFLLGNGHMDRFQKMIDSIPAHCPGIAHLSVADDRHAILPDWLKKWRESIKSLEIRDGNHANETESLAAVAKECPKLTSVSLLGSTLKSDEDVVHAMQIKQLNGLELAFPFTNVAVGFIAYACKEKRVALTRLSLNSDATGSINDQTLGLLTHCTDLQDLTLRMDPSFTSARNKKVGALLSSLPRIESFCVRSLGQDLVKMSITEECRKAWAAARTSNGST